MKNALPWIIGIAIVIAVIYFVYSRNKKSAASVFVPPPPTAPTTATNPTINTNQNIAPTSTAQLPPVVSGSTLSNASCLNTPQVVSLIKTFKESKAYQIPLRMQIKDTMGAICPEGLRYLVR